ncbi:hypothetical protein [Halorussus sp. AFM4]|uniref:hypothetical protein n=1 Tax=Halorussus sp. AFM4 TaxID=3421651 RepID=UPI003EBCE506
MVAIQNPFSRDLTQVEADEVDQPRPTNPRYGEPESTVAVRAPCEACGCRWVTNPEIVIPEGLVECGHCGMVRGHLYRDSKLTEYADEDTTSADGSTFEYKRVSGGPQDGFDELLNGSRYLVFVSPWFDFLSAFDALVERCPYMRHRFLEDHSLEGE